MRLMTLTVLVASLFMVGCTGVKELGPAEEGGETVSQEEMQKQMQRSIEEMQKDPRMKEMMKKQGMTPEQMLKGYGNPDAAPKGGAPAGNQ